MDQNTKIYFSKINTFKMIIIFFFSILVIRLFYLQVIFGDEFRKYSERNSIKEISVPGARGLILDRNSEVLVQNELHYQLNLNLQYIKDLEKTLEALSPIIKISPERMEKMIEKSKKIYGRFYPAKIKSHLNLNEISQLSHLELTYPGLEIQGVILRKYPLKNIGSHLMGYLGKMSLEKYKKNRVHQAHLKYQKNDSVGLYGLEKKYESQLRGVPGRSFIQIDARGKLIQDKQASFFFEIEEDKAQKGNDLHLTIDKDLQKIAYQSFKKHSKNPEKLSGAIVALNDKAEVLVWLSFPDFDPNDFVEGISQEKWEKLQKNSMDPFIDRVYQNHYSPGSTLKPLIALSALNEKLIHENEKIHSPASMYFKDRTYHDHRRKSYGNIDLFEAIERSSNTFFYQLGMRLKIDLMSYYAKLFGLGEKTKINLSQEKKGLIPERAWKKRVLNKVWHPGEDLLVAIGQSFTLSTPLQMALLYLSIGLEGKRYQPFLVKKITNQKNELIFENKENLIEDLSKKIHKKHFKSLKKALSQVIHGEKGTARFWKIPKAQFKMAGKTGTSQVRSFSRKNIFSSCKLLPLKQRHHAWFAGFAPLDKALISVAVISEHACSGSYGASPIFRDIVQAYFKKYHPERFKK